MAKITKCIRCGASWSGRSQHCGACHLTFGGTGAGDRHRVGPYGGGRRCLTDSECRDAGLHTTPDRVTGEPIWGRQTPDTESWRTSREAS